MITSVTFSKDRPAQLDLFLTSMYQNARQLFLDNKILYTFSNKNYEKGYKKVIDKWSDIHEFHLQKDFCKDTRRLFDTKNRFVCGFKDDDIIYRKIPIKPHEINSVFEEMEIGCISLRTGKNTTEIYEFVKKDEKENEDKPKLEHPKYLADYEDKILIWNRLSTGHINYNYILSLNGHIFKAKTLNYLINAFEFDNPNHLEARLQKYLIFIAPLMSSLYNSVVVNTPINKVQSTNNNTFGLKHEFNQEEMNKQFLNGKVIDFDSIDFGNVNSTHQELELKMI